MGKAAVGVKDQPQVWHAHSDRVRRDDQRPKADGRRCDSTRRPEFRYKRGPVSTALCQMLLFVIAVPGRFAKWCQSVTAGLAGHGLGPVEQIEANTLDELSRSLLRLGASQAVVASPCPSGRLRAALIEAGRRFVVARDDPRVALSDLVSRDRMGLAAATKLVASSCAAVAGCISDPGALVLDADMAGADAKSIAVAIAAHLQLPISASTAAEIAGNLPDADVIPERQGSDLWWSQLLDVEKAIALGAFGPYIDGLGPSHLRPVSWAPELFQLGDRPAEPAAGPIDITGRARCLLQGPHIILPAGEWSLSLRLLFSPEAAEHEFAIEICADRPLQHQLIRAHSGGTFSATIGFTVDEAAEHPIDISLSSQRAAFDGTVTMIGATLRPQDAS
jgi:hypothetical protein